MTQPDYAPIAATERVRPVDKLPTPLAWWADRPADRSAPAASGSNGARFGTTGPDQGYALSLAGRFHDRLTLSGGVTPEDAITGCLGVALRRASLFDRAPVIFDVELAFTLWGFLGDAPEDLVAFRRPLFGAAAHHYWAQREIASRVLPGTLRLSPAQVRARLGDWRAMIDATKC